MLGAIIGDIAGSKYEFNNIRTEEFELMGSGCDFTDDTKAQALAMLPDEIKTVIDQFNKSIK